MEEMEGLARCLGGQCPTNNAASGEIERISKSVEIPVPGSLVSLDHDRQISFVPNFYRMVKRAAIIARMFYHTGIGLLCESNPLSPTNIQVQQDMSTWQLNNAKELCGIVAHVKDRSAFYVQKFATS